MTNLSGTNLNRREATGPKGEGRDSPSSFTKYPEYKDSGVEWLGEVPAHWVVSPFKWQIDANDGGAWGEDPLGDNDTYVLRSTDQTVDGRWKITEPALRHLSPKEQASTVLKAGDLVVTKSSGSSLHIGKTTLVDKCMASKGFSFGNFMQRIRTKRSFLPKLAWYFMNNAVARLQLDLLSNSTTGLANLNGTIIGEVKVATPPQKEQTDIVAFLDHETARIDALVEEQQRLIELLKEKRQAVISHAVTKGLDPDVPMKDSGVEWLGEVPAHWEVMKFVRCVEIAEGQVDPKLEGYRGKILIAPNHVESATGRILFLESAEEQGAESGKYVCQPRDVIYSKIRPALRKACMLDQNALCSADMYPLRPFGGLTSEFLLWSILSEPFSRLTVLESERVAMPKINRESLNETYMAIPPTHEQERVVFYISEETRRLDKLTSIAEDSVGFLAERRSALISAAVTGKIDVRGWQPPAGSSATSEHTQTELV